MAVLVSKGFVRILNEDLAAYILDWNVNNYIRPDRYRESIYKDLIAASCDAVLLDGDTLSTDGIPMVNEMDTQVRLGKDRLGKVSTEEREVAEKPPKRTRFVPPTVDEVRTYCQENSYGIDPEHFVDYYTANNWMAGRNKMKDWKAAVRNWNRREKGSQVTVKARPKIPGVDTI